MLLATHLGFGLLIYLLILVVTPLDFGIIPLILFFIGVLTPDIDNPNATIGRKFKILSRGINSIFSHRGIVHSLLGALIFTGLLTLLLYSLEVSLVYVYWYFLGFLAHLTADSFTPHGIRWLAPFSDRKLRFYIRSGSIVEWLFIVFVYATIAFIYYRLLIA